MTEPAAHWERVQSLLNDALSQTAERRIDWLKGACAGDAALEHEVADLIEAHDEGLLGEPGDSAEPRLYGLPADHFGPYRIIRPLGHGGMGAVFLAERTTGDVSYHVALKLLRAEFAGSELAAHFATERRILARLEHPGIARLIDAGTTPQGQPFFAMEFVDGVDLISWARQQHLDVEQRVRLMLAVCAAVDHAHRQLVVHRDLKPSNIMVPEDGRPRLLDFGIGRLLDPEPQDAARVRTLRWLTPDYASPEQVRGESAGITSDVYSLGVLLFELLTDTLPFRLEGLSPVAVEQVISHQAPPRPSERVDDRARRRELRGDLDTIVLKALAKEPERRYDSARELDNDLRRYLDHEPVKARPDTFAYRTSAFVRRHRAGVGAAGLALALLIGGLATTAWQATLAGRARDRAESEAGAAQQVSAFLVSMFDVSDLGAVPGDVAVARGIVRRGVARADALQGQPLAQARILDALGMVYVGLGQYDTAFALVTRGLDQRRAGLGSGHPDVAESLRHLGRIERARGHYREAEAALDEALAIQQKSLGPHHRATIQTLDDIAFLMPYLGSESEAERYRRMALDLTVRYYADDEALVTSRKVWLSEIARRRGNYGESAALLRDAIAYYSRSNDGTSWDVADMTIRLGDVLRDSGAVPATIEPLYRQGLRIALAVLGPSNVRLAYPYISTAYLLADERKFAEAEAMIRDAQVIRRTVLGPDHPQLAEGTDDLCHVLRLAGLYAEAESAAREALALWSRSLGPNHVATANALLSLGQVFDATGRYAAADSAMRAALARREQGLGRGHVTVGVTLTELALIQIHEGKPAAAESSVTRALTILRAHQEPSHRDVRAAHARLAEVYVAMNRPADAARERSLANP